MATSDEVREVVARELARAPDGDRRAAFEQLLCEPYQQTRVWDWANSDEQVPVWIFAVSADGRIGFAYSRAGYQDPWGALFMNEDSLGMDAQWYLYLDDAFIDSGVWTGPVPAGFEVR
jgi:hypothetical protein